MADTTRLTLAALASLSLLHSLPVAAHENDDPLLSKVMIDQLEWRNTDDEDPYALDAQAWIGKDLHKLWLKLDVEHREGATEEAEIQALYSRAITPFWDLQIGWRRDIKPTPTRDWGVIGIQGLAPYFLDINAALFVQDSGDTAARLSAEHDIMLTQQWVVSPEVSLSAYGQTDQETMTGSGISDAQMGLRLRYEIRREFAPYIGIIWQKKFGTTADFAQSAQEPVSDTQWVAGIRAWF